MKNETVNKIIQYINKQGRVTPAQVVAEFGLSPQIVARHLKRLLESNQIAKQGKAPRVYYQTVVQSSSFSKELPNNEIIEKNFLYISPLGEIKEGQNGFNEWCKRTKQDPLKTTVQYIDTLAKYDKFKK